MVDHSYRRPIWFPHQWAAPALLTGGGMYVYLRDGPFVFHRWIRVLFPAYDQARLRHHGPHTSWPLPDWILYSLPNGLWAFAYALLMTVIWANQRSLLKYFWLGTVPLLVFGLKILQLTGTLPGTFCGLDLILGGGGAVAGIGLGDCWHRNCHTKNPIHRENFNE